jgi:hypothetical protein
MLNRKARKQEGVAATQGRRCRKSNAERIAREMHAKKKQ